VSTAENGPQALERMSAGTPPDMVILDLAMPEMEGTEVVLKMKADRKLMRVPILVVTGANVNRAKAEIMNGFAIPALSKPWREADLLDCVESAFLGRAWVGR